MTIIHVVNAKYLLIKIDTFCPYTNKYNEILEMVLQQENAYKLQG